MVFLSQSLPSGFGACCNFNSQFRNSHVYCRRSHLWSMYSVVQVWGYVAFNIRNWLSMTLSRSLILCHSKTNDDCPDERHGGTVSERCRTWGPGWKTDDTAGDQTHHRDTENRHWRKTQQSSLERNENTDKDHLVHPTTTLRETKRSIRRSFSIKVRLH